MITRGESQRGRRASEQANELGGEGVVGRKEGSKGRSTEVGPLAKSEFSLLSRHGGGGVERAALAIQVYGGATARTRVKKRVKGR